MIYKVTLFKEGSKDPVEVQEFHAKEFRSKNILEKALKSTKFYLQCYHQNSKKVQMFVQSN